MRPLLDWTFLDPVKIQDEGVHAVCTAAWSFSRGDLIWDLFQARSTSGLALDATSHGFLLMDASWSGQQGRETEVTGSLTACVVVDILRSVVERSLLDTETFFGFSLRPNLRTSSPGDEGVWYRYQKLGALVHFVEATAGPDPQAVLRSVENFVQEAHHRWLKVAGGPKASVVHSAAAPLSHFTVAVEMGCFVGYTAIRLGWRLGVGSWGSSSRTSLVSTELEAVHVCISRHHVDAARLSGATEVWAGHIPWATPRYVEQFGAGGIGFTFMDHKGTRFHADLGHCRSCAALAPRSRLLCDNVLKPGAPVHLWMHHRSVAGVSSSAVVWSLHEFMEPECEDWQSVRDDSPRPQRETPFDPMSDSRL